MTMATEPIMTLEEIVSRAIPYSKNECAIGKGMKDAARKQAIKRIMAWHDAEVRAMNVEYMPEGKQLVKSRPFNLPGIDDSEVIPSSPILIKENKYK